MLAQVIFRTDKSLKEAALKKARLEGVTLRALFTLCLKAYISDKLKLGISQESEIEKVQVTPEIQAKMDQIASLIEEKKL